MNPSEKHSPDSRKLLNSNSSSIIRPGLWTSGKNLKNVKEKLRNKVPPIRVAHNYKAIIKNLLEEGFENSARYIENLLELEKSILRDGLVQKTILKASFDILEELIETLKGIENHPNDAPSYLNDLLKFLCGIKDVNKNNSWIIEQAFLLLKNYTKNCDLNDNGLLETKIKFYYGKFLFENELHEDALTNLFDARNMCEGKFWINDDLKSTTTTTTKNVRYLYNDINNLIAICYMRLYKIEKLSHSDLMHKHAENALKYANCSLNERTIAKANLLLAKVLIRKHRSIQALNFLEVGISYANEISDIEILCKCYKRKAQIYHERGRIDLAEEFMQLVISMSEGNDHLSTYTGISLRLLAKWNSAIGNYDKAANYYSRALKKFLVNNTEKLILETRILFSQMFYKILGCNYFELIESITVSSYRHSRLSSFYSEHFYIEEGHKLQQQQLSSIVTQKQEQELRYIYKNLLDKILLWRCERIPFWYGDMDNENLDKAFCNQLKTESKGNVDVELNENESEREKFAN